MSEEEHWPNRGPTTIGVTIFVTALSTFIALWRLAVRFRLNPRMGWSDYWIICALPLAITGHVLAILGAHYGEGRRDGDPFLTADQVAEAKKFMFFQRCFNLYAMLAAKLSICCYVLALNFSKAYRVTIWISLVIIVMFLGLVPGIAHWSQCQPLKFRWDNRVKGNCWGGNQFKYVSGYLQTVTNVLTDMLYAAAPILYLRRVKLNRYTKIGVQGVFLCSLLGTGVSIGKLIEFRRSYGKKDELWKASTSTMLSVSENSMAIIVACLPPLRRTFDDFLKRILPEHLLTKIGASQPRSQNNALPTIYSNKNRGLGGAMKSGIDDDADSELAILEGGDYIEDGHGRILRTTKVVITTDRSSEYGSDRQRPVS